MSLGCHWHPAAPVQTDGLAVGIVVLQMDLGAALCPGWPPLSGPAAAACSGLCGKSQPDIPLRKGFMCGPSLAAWRVFCVPAAGNPSRASMSLGWLSRACCSVQLGVAFVCCHGFFWAGSGNVRPDLEAGSGFVPGPSPGAWDSFWVQPPGNRWRAAMPSVGWTCGSCCWCAGLLYGRSRGVLGAAEMPPDPQRGMGELPSAVSWAHWAGGCSQAAGIYVRGPMLPGCWGRS